jgi:hypothetical protein
MTTMSSSLNLLMSYKTLELVSAEVFRALFLVLWRLSPLSPVSARNLTRPHGDFWQASWAIWRYGGQVPESHRNHPGLA